ncbi:MAG: Gfo/Idh/MocA family oxidoreductase [Victivallales bacterium]|nr:Gfo/Idh/MocA family oxidoreductase [Victivallales bacterium]
MHDKVRIGVAGYGPRGRQMAYIARLLPECCVLTAIGDICDEALERAKGDFPDVRLFHQTEELLTSGLIDAVITEIPPEAHTECVVRALGLGIHVLGEIPCVNSIEEGERLWKAASESKAIYMCGSNPNYHARTRFILRLKELGLLGRIAYVEAEYVHGTGDPVKKVTWRTAYEPCRYCTHSLGPVLALTGEEFTHVSCMSTYDRLGNGRAHNAMSALLRTRDNLVVRLLTAFGMPSQGPQHTIRIFSEKATLWVYSEKVRVWFKEMKEFQTFHNDDNFIEFPLMPNRNSRPQNLHIIDEDIFEKASFGHAGADNYMLKAFAEAILEGRPSPLGVREGLAMTLPGLYASASAAEGGELKRIIYPWG